MTTGYQTIHLDITPPFAQLTLNRPAQRNAMSFEMVDELITAFTELAARQDIRAVVVTGAGSHFCAGGDINDLASVDALSPAQQDETAARLDTMLRAVQSAPQIVIARVEGAALGGGFGLVCVSDIAVASDSASFGLPEVRIGLAPALIAPYVLQRIGLTRARHLMLTGNRFDGKTALDYGLVHESVPTDEVDGRIETLLNEIRDCSPNSIATIKRLLMDITDRAPADSLTERARLLNTMRQSEEGQEGMTAFLQKRPPKWASS